LKLKYDEPVSTVAFKFLLRRYRMVRNSSKSKRGKQVNKNMKIVERLRDFFPDNRDSLTKARGV
jgi:predicted secreted acid phosphatase